MTKKILSTTLAITTMAVITVVATTLLWTPTNAQGDTPGKPTGLTSTGHTHNTADLAWTASTSENVDGYKILRRNVRRQDPGVFTEAGAVDADTTVYTDDGVAAETKYAYRVAATAGDLESPWSNYVNVTTDAAPDDVQQAPPEPTQEPEHSEQGQEQEPSPPLPNRPTNIRYRDLTHESLWIEWDAPTDDSGVEFYQIMRRTVSTSSSSTVSTKQYVLTDNQGDNNPENDVYELRDVPADRLRNYERSYYHRPSPSTPSKKYYYMVVAVGYEDPNDGDERQTAASNGLLVSFKPTPPAFFHLEEREFQSITLHWWSPEEMDFADIIEFRMTEQVTRDGSRRQEQHLITAGRSNKPH